jgi:hypothetical protein
VIVANTLGYLFEVSHSLLCLNMDGLKLLQMFMDHESLKLEPKEKRLARTVNMFNIDL